MLNLNWNEKRSGTNVVMKCEEAKNLKLNKEKIMKKLTRGTFVLLMVGMLAVLGSGAALADGPTTFEQIENRNQLAQYQAQVMDMAVPSADLQEPVAVEEPGGPGQIANRAELAEYQASLADNVAPVDISFELVIVVAQRKYEQIENRSQLAEYQAYIADGPAPVDASTVQLAALPQNEFDQIANRQVLASYRSGRR
jgi:hypothetical protein